jgi:hypothetical protein
MQFWPRENSLGVEDSLSPGRRRRLGGLSVDSGHECLACILQVLLISVKEQVFDWLCRMKSRNGIESSGVTSTSIERRGQEDKFRPLPVCSSQNRSESPSTSAATSVFVTPLLSSLLGLAMRFDPFICLLCVLKMAMPPGNARFGL